MLTRIINRLKLLLPQDTKKVFRSIYKKNGWGSAESISGPGSTLAYTEQLRVELPVLFASLGIRSLLDAPCGDANWIAKVDLAGITYTGAEIVPEIIEANQQNHPGKNFILVNIIHDQLPAADLVLCRDCFIHLRNKEIIKVIRNFKRAGCRYMLASTYPVTRNTEILTGHFRPVNLELAPFSLPVPLQKIKDYPDGEPERYLGLWLLEDLNL